MEPVTHALTSLALARATQKHLPRFGTAILIVSGVAVDLDYVSYFSGPGAFLRFHRAVLHSLPGILVLVSVIAGVFCWMNRKFPAKKPTVPLPFIAAFTFAYLAGSAILPVAGEFLNDKDLIGSFLPTERKIQETVYKSMDRKPSVRLASFASAPPIP